MIQMSLLGFLLVLICTAIVGAMLGWIVTCLQHASFCSHVINKMDDLESRHLENVKETERLREKARQFERA